MKYVIKTRQSFLRSAKIKIKWHFLNRSVKYRVSTLFRDQHGLTAALASAINSYMEIRRFKNSDTSILIELFRNTVHTVCKGDYSAEQLHTWAPKEIDADKWTGRFINSYTVVAEDRGRLAGFANLESDGCVDMLYVGSNYQDQGVGTLLFKALEAEAKSRDLKKLHSDVSVTARRFFFSKGFIVEKEYFKEVGMVTFPNTIMTKLLTDIEKEDSLIARYLLIGVVVCALLSTPMFMVHFREALEKKHLPIGVHFMLIIEILKVTLFSWFAVKLGKRWASPVGIDAPVLRGIIRGQTKTAVEAAKKAILIGVFLGVIGFVVKLGAGLLLGETVRGTLTIYNLGLSPLVVADGVFYQCGVTLWFGWGVLSLAAYVVSSVTGISLARAFPWANAVASLAFGLFACVSVYGPHHGEAGAFKYILEAFLLYGLPNFFFCLAIRRLGFLSAVAGVSASTLLGAAVAAVLV